MRKDAETDHPAISEEEGAYANSTVLKKFMYKVNSKSLKFFWGKISDNLAHYYGHKFPNLPPSPHLKVAEHLQGSYLETF